MSADAYRDANRSVADRVDDLLRRMTLEEKVAQLTGMLPFGLLGPHGLDEKRVEQRLANGIGQISMAGVLSPDPAHLIPMLNQIQRFLVERTRLGIPAVAHHEALAGLIHQACFDFPTAISLAASWDPESVEAMNGIVRRQMRALGIHQALSPVLDIARDARWGRVQETYGEDPYLCSALGVAFVRGLQGDDLRDGVVATAKHFLGYSMADGGRNLGPVRLGERELLEVYGRPYSAAIAEASLGSAMCAYSDMNGEPVAGSRHLMTGILRDLLGFQGYMVADYGAVDGLHRRQQTAADAADAAVQALEAGLDVELPGSDAYDAGIAPAVRAGVLDEAVVDHSVRRVLTAKFRLGLFENPYGDEEAFAATTADAPRRTAQTLARQMATRSTVLLANPKGLLPLPRNLARVAVVGPNARSVRNLFGGYSSPMSIETLSSGALAMLAPVLGGGDAAAEPQGGDNAYGFVRRIEARPSDAAMSAVEAAYPDTPTVLAAIEAVFADGTEVVYAQGCYINDPSTDGIAEAVDACVGSDVAIVVVGDKTGLVGDAVVGETRDRSTLELAGAQQALLDAVCATGVPVVVVLLGSQPVPVLAQEGGPDAVVHGWLPGSVGGVAVAEVLFGIENPSGKLPITIPRTAGQCPIFYGYRTGGEPNTYTDLEDSGPAYAFGHGLSYTTFEYRSITVDSVEVDAEGAVQVHVEVANTGDRAGEEVVQLYAAIRRRRITRPIRELVGFHRVAVEPGGVATVSFTLQPAILAYYDVDMNFVITPGEVRLMAGPSSATLPLATAFTITGEPRTLARRTVHFTASSITHL